MKKHGHRQSAERDRDTNQEWVWAQPVRRSDLSGRPREQRDCAIASELVEPHCEPAPLRAVQIDLHDYRHRPSETLARPQPHVREQHPRPARGPDEHQRHRKRREPPCDQDPLAPESVRKAAAQIVRGRLREAERDQEGKGGGARRDVKVALGKQRQDRALDADHSSYERVHPDEQRELHKVRSQPNATRICQGLRPWLKRRMVSNSDGGAATAPETWATKASRSMERTRFHRFSNANVLQGFPLRLRPPIETTFSALTTMSTSEAARSS